MSRENVAGVKVEVSVLISGDSGGRCGWWQGVRGDSLTHCACIIFGAKHVVVNWSIVSTFPCLDHAISVTTDKPSEILL